MKDKLIQALAKWTTPWVTSLELALVLGLSEDAVDSALRRAVRAGYLVHLCRGIYLISDKLGAAKPDAHEIAQVIYGPSYVSFEAALSFHGWIPERVTVLTSATPRRGKEVRTPIGVFAYERIPTAAFSLGVKHYKVDSTSFLMAEPWKAIADLIYARRRLWPNLQGLSHDLRIEMDTLLESDVELLSELAAAYPSSRTRRCLTTLRKEFQA